MEKNAFILGATQGIGLATTQNLLENNTFTTVFASYRTTSQQQALLNLKKSYPKKLILLEINALSEQSFITAQEHLQKSTSQIHLAINCIGTLSDETFNPERSLKDLSADWMVQSFKINTIPSLFFAKHFKKYLDAPSIFITLSAKVGSINDNKTGGWHSYRISKAALNMAIKNISIELNRMAHKCTTLAIHPGTTDSNMSSQFIENARKKYKVHTTHETAHNIINIALKEDIHKYNGQFLSWDGSELPW